MLVMIPDLHKIINTFTVAHYGDQITLQNTITSTMFRNIEILHALKLNSSAVDPTNERFKGSYQGSEQSWFLKKNTDPGQDHQVWRHPVQLWKHSQAWCRDALLWDKTSRQHITQHRSLQCSGGLEVRKSHSQRKQENTFLIWILTQKLKDKLIFLNSSIST